MAFTAAALLFERVVRIGIGFVVTGLVARHLGPGAFGELSFGLALGAIGAGIAQCGMDSILVRDFVRHPDAAGTLLFTSGAVRFVGAAICWIAMSALATRTESGSIAVITVLCLTSFTAVSSVPALWLQTHDRAWHSTWALLAIFGSASVGRVWLALHGGSILAFAWVAVAETMANGLVSYAQVRHTGTGAWSFSADVARRLLAESWPVALAAVAFLGYTRFDQVLISHLAGQSELGLYAAALRLTEQGYLLPVVLATPMLGLIANSEPAEARRRTTRYVAASAILAYAFVAVVWFAAPVVYGTFFGRAYAAAVPIARIQVWMAPFIAVGYARNQVVISEGRTVFALVAALAGLIANLALNLALIPRFGGIGAAWAGLLAQAMSLVVSTWWSRPLRWVARVQLISLIAPWRMLFRSTALPA